MEFGNLNFESPKILTLQLMEVIEEKIRNKELPVGKKLPPQDELRKIFKVSIKTVNEALSKLAEKGYLSCRPRYGTIVINSEPKKGIDLKRKNEIAVVISPTREGSSFSDPFSHPRYRYIMEGIEKETKEKGMYIIYSTIKNVDDVSFLKEKRKDIAGIVVVESTSKENYRRMKSLKIPFVLIGDIFREKLAEPEVDVICNDDFQSSYLATKHLIDLGHRRIGYVTYSVRYSWEIEKLRGYEEALRESGIVCDKNLEIEIEESNEEKTSIELKKSIKKSMSFTALICNDAELCTGVKNVLKERGARIPEDVSIISGMKSYEFTCLSYEYKDMGKVAVERLIERLTNPEWKPGRIVVPYKLTIRDSTRRIEPGFRKKDKRSKTI
jgi:LacI family transcriptional regulator